MHKLSFSFFLFLLSFVTSAQAQNLTYAEVTDIHIGQNQSVESAINTINDINKNPVIKFVLITGDLTNDGSDEQLYKAKELLDKLNKKFYVIPGNHEDAWSESGGTSFNKIFKTNRFMFEAGGYLFIGTDCGPMLRHGPAHIPKEDLNWLDSALNKMKDKHEPVIFANHYPIDSTVDNSNDVIKILKKYNIQLILCGHGHSNRKLNFSGIPGVMCRTNLPIKNQGGYNIVNINNNVIAFRLRLPAIDTLLLPWNTETLKEIPKEDIKIKEPDYGVNASNNYVKLKWRYDNPLGISGGFAIDGDYLYTGTYDGFLIALNKLTGEKVWSFNAGGRIYATPAVSKNKIVFTSTNGNVYCITTMGKLCWKFKSEKAIVSSPLIKGNRVFAGFSDQSFRCLNLETGYMIWSFDQIKEGFVESPMLYNGKIYFGAWNSRLYALDQLTGKLVWTWTNKKGFAYSPAFIAPVEVNNRIFIVTPDYYVTCFEPNTGKIIWRETKPDVPVWFARGLSKDSSTLYVKTRNNKGFGISTSADSMKVVWEAPINIYNDSSVTSINDDDKEVYFSSQYGSVIAVSKKTAKTTWEYKTSNTSINMILVADQNDIYVSTVDGKIERLKVNSNR